MRTTNPRRRLTPALATVGLWLLAGAAPAPGECTSMSYSPNLARPGETIGLRPSADLPAGLIDAAVELWRQCSNYGVGFPAVVAGTGQARTVTVEYRRHSRSTSCGRFRGNRIELYAFARGPRGRPFHCGSVAMALAHEIGHVLGLADSPVATACRGHIMSHLDRRNRRHRSVRDEECQAASQRWLTLAERRWAGGGSGEAGR